MKFLKNSFIYLFFEIVNKAIPFLLLPILTKHLTPMEFGVYGLYQVALVFLTPFLRMSLDLHITRNFFKLSKEELSKIISTILVILHLNFFIVTVVIFLITLIWHNPFGIPARILDIMPLIILAQTINTFNLTILRNEEHALRYGLIQMALTTTNYGVALILLLRFDAGWPSLVYGVLFSHVFIGLFSLYFMKKSYRLGLNFTSFKDIYAISLPLIFHLLGGSIIFFSDRIFLQQMMDLKTVGYYTVGSQFGNIAMIVINAVIMAVSPWLYKNLAQDNQKIVMGMYGLMGLFVFLGGMVWAVSLLLFPWMVDHSYDTAKHVIIWIVIAFVFRGWYQIFYNIIVHEGKTKIFMYTTMLAAIINLILNYFFIKANGMIGAAQATAVAFLLMFLTTFLYASKISDLKLIGLKK